MTTLDPAPEIGGRFDADALRAHEDSVLAGAVGAAA